MLIDKTALMSVACLPIEDAAKVFNMGSTLFKAKCRHLGLTRWPYRKMASLKLLNDRLAARLEWASARQHHELCAHLKLQMDEVASFTELLMDTGMLDWPENILRIRQIAYKRHHATTKSEDETPKLEPLSDEEMWEPFLFDMNDILASI